MIWYPATAAPNAPPLCVIGPIVGGVVLQLLQRLRVDFPARAESVRDVEQGVRRDLERVRHGQRP